jgi:riboflavin kinase/FMN adenylyltransferase
VVIHGQKLGRTLGFPTVNLARSFDQVMLADGVYAARAASKFGDFDAALAVGMRPAVGGAARTIEAFLLNYPGESLYGSVVRLDVIEFLRPEQNFSSLDDLVVQMKEDVKRVRQIMGSQ